MLLDSAIVFDLAAFQPNIRKSKMSELRIFQVDSFGGPVVSGHGLESLHIRPCILRLINAGSSAWLAPWGFSAEQF
jgi:hypothetical protein